jgi:hypothetical protein
MVYDKEAQIEYKEMKLQEYSYYCGDLCGGGGIQFVASENEAIIIYQTQDWIS